MNKNTVLLTITAMILSIAVPAFAGSSDLDFVLQKSRTEVLTGIPSPPSNPPTPDGKGTRTQFLWEDFETSTFPPTGWDTLNLNPGYGWMLSTYTGGGTKAAMVTWDQEPPVTLQDEWLITPRLDVSAATTQLRVEFYMLQGYTYPHDFTVYITDDNGTVWNDIFSSDTIGYPAHEWFFVSIPLTDWAGSTDSIRIAFQYYGTDADLFGIDNVEITDDDLATGRCCVYTDPLNPDCYDDLTQSECDGYGGIWAEGLDCSSNPCPIQGQQLEPSDDLYTDPGSGSGHPHPVEQTSLWTADFDGAGHHQRIMLKWELSAFAGQSVDSAFVNIYRYFRCPGDYYTNCDLYVITEDWEEDTWNDYVHISHEAIPFMSFNFGPALDWYRLDISGLVDQWLDGTLNNYGIVIQARSGQKWSKFYSKEGTYAPYLELYGISAMNQCPVLETIADQLCGVDNNLSINLSATDPDLTTPDLFCDNPPAGAVFTDNHDGTGVFDWTPSENQTGDHNILFYADDGELADSQYVSILIYACGDANNDWTVDVSDAVYIINYAFAGGSPPDPYVSGDANCDGSVDVSDAVYIINFAFAGGNDPCDPNGDGIPDC